MKSLKNHFAAALVVLALSACGKSELPAENSSAPILIPARQEAIQSGNYSTLVPTSILVTQADQQKEIEGQKINLPAKTELTILEIKNDPDKGVMLHLGLDLNEDTSLPSDIWVKESDLPVASFVQTEESDYENEDSPEDTSARKRMTYCYRYVKQYLLRTGKVKVYLPGSSAYQAASILPKHGFVKTGHSPESAVNGEVCVYRGGNGGHGHIEVKIKGKWWYGYGYKPYPISRKNHPFIGCFYK